MEHGKALPPPLLVERVSIIKMHGGTHNLLVDERLDYILSSEYKAAFHTLTGPNPLLLVIGCSGHDRRLADLVGSAINHNQAEVLWSIYGRSVDDPRTPETRNLPAGKDASLFTVSIRDCALFLASIYTALTGRFPSSPVPYPVRIVRPFPTVWL